MPDRPLVLVLADDANVATTRTSRHLCLALERLGHTAVCRDTRLLRWAVAQLEKESSARRDAYETIVIAKWAKFVFDYGIKSIVSLELDWLFSSKLFHDDDSIGRIDSFWLEDVGSSLRRARTFPLDSQARLALMNEGKVHHHGASRAHVAELQLLGVKDISLSLPAAPAEYLAVEDGCTTRNRLGFLGGPGSNVPPSTAARTAMEKGESLTALRMIARQEILDEILTATQGAAWIKACPSVLDLVAAATEARLHQPHTPALALLMQAGDVFREAINFLMHDGSILDATALVKRVNRYDCPALVHRLWRRGWLEVHGAPEQWAPYGITAQPSVPFPEIASVYRRYPAMLNLTACAGEPAVNQELFEMAACGRISLSFGSADLRACYPSDEIVVCDTEDGWEAAADKILRDPAAALTLGEGARRVTEHQHLWDHRLGKVLV